MRILVGKTFGLGNAVLSVPMVKALSTLGEVDVLVGSTKDDWGAVDVFHQLQAIGDVKQVFVDAVHSKHYDAAVMAIPFDGRWVNGYHFKADRVLDCRKRPGNVDRLGFEMWKLHEVEYQMENARELGYTGSTSDCDFWSEGQDIQPDLVYLGVGYKRDEGGFGASKHWGNENFVRFMRRVKEVRPSVHFVSTGGVVDLIQTGKHLMAATASEHNDKELLTFRTENWRTSFAVMAGCGSYFGNDTGMMHVAASMGIPTYGQTPYRDLAVKNPPWCIRSRMLVSPGFTPEWVAEDFVNFVWGHP